MGLTTASLGYSHLKHRFLPALVSYLYNNLYQDLKLGVCTVHL